MKVASLSLALISTGATAEDARANPLGMVISLMDETSAKIVKDGEAQEKAYTEYFEWCDETSQNTGFAIKTATKEKGQLEAKIKEYSSDIEVATSKIEELAAAIAANEKDIKDATAVREKEAADFAASEKELVEAVSALTRASDVLNKEMAKNAASFAQLDTSNMASALQALTVVLDAASLSSSDKKTLAALVQSQSDADDEDSGAPAAAVYKNKSGGILDVLEDMKDKAETQLADLRKAETKATHNFEMMKSSLEAQKGADTKELEDEKSGRSAAEEDKATAEGDLETTSKELAESTKELATTRQVCIQSASDHEQTVAARKEELAVIAKAKQILVETSKGAVEKTYSFLQASSQLRTSSDLAGSEVVVAVKQLAKSQRSSALAQLASRIAATLRRGRSSADVFGKVKGLIRDMIAKLEKEAEADAEEKAYCDEQMSKTEAKKSDLEDDIEKMTSRIDTASAKSAELKEQIKALEKELAELAKEQAELDKIRGEENADFRATKADLDAGLGGVRKALQVLQEYYGASASMLQDESRFGAFMQQPAAPEKFQKSSGAGGSIIDILQTVESDFATNLAKVEAEEADAQADYDKVTQENAVSKTSKEQDVKYKTQESKSLDKTAIEYSADRKTANAELEAVNKYYGTIKDRCIAKPESYAERKARREAEIAGLKEAMSILENEAALVQRKHRSFRGSLSAM